MRTRNIARGAAVASLFFSACASVDPQPDFDEAARLAVAATGVSEVYGPGRDEEIRDRVEAHLAEGLELFEAVEVALLNNPRLQRSFLRLGVSRADLVQAGLLANPVLGIALRFPSGGGATEIESEIAQDIARLWGMGSRKRMAQAELDAAVLEVAREASALAVRTQLAYFEVLAAREREIIADENVAVARDLVLVAEAREEAGSGTLLEVNVSHSELGESELEKREAELANQEATLTLAAALGLDRPLPAEALVSELPEPLTWEADEELLVEMAGRSRLDLEAARRVVAAARERLEVEQKGRLPDVELGISHERADGTTALGPAARVELPLFDQNQAQIAKARYLLAAAEKERWALEQDVRRQVLRAYRRARVEGEMTTFYRDDLLPRNRQNMELAREAYQEGKVSFLSALEAQQRFLATRREYVERRLRSAVARPELERVLGIPLGKALVLQAKELERKEGDGHDR